MGGTEISRNSNSAPQWTLLTDDEIRRNMRAVADAIAQQELEGLTVSPETTADMESAARGEIDSAEETPHLPATRKRAAPGWGVKVPLRPVNQTRF
ncbi:MAG: hypothetical protein WB676_02800 [Bryobacteraceae bacterium]